MGTLTQSIHSSIFACETREQKKQLLKLLSLDAKETIELSAEPRTVNSVLIEMYKNEEHQEFNNFHQWLKLGFKVKKGSKAFFVWSKKRVGTEKAENSDEEREFKFFTLAYLFSNAQVEPLKVKENA